MPLDQQLWREAFMFETVPACPKGMRLAEIFLAACGHAVENVHRADSTVMVTIRSRWTDFASHVSTCDSCQKK